MSEAKTQRVKQWFKNDELAHVWANEGAPRGRTSAHMHFDGLAFLSYGTVIGRIIKKGKVKAFVVDSNSFSSTTGKHRCHMMKAIPESANVFSVDGGCRGQSLSFTPASLKKHYLDQMAEKQEEDGSKFDWMRAQAIIRRAGWLDDAIRVCRVFKMPYVKLSALKKSISGKVRKARKILADRSAFLEARRKEQDAADEAARKISNQEYIEAAVAAARHAIKTKALTRDAEKLFGYQGQWLADYLELKTGIAKLREKRDADAMREWKSGDPAVYASYDWPVMLRAEAEEMVSSKGARVPLVDARRAFLFVRKVKARGWRRNGKQFKVGMYDIDSVSKVGVVAGCHSIPWKEIMRFAKTQKWV